MLVFGKNVAKELIRNKKQINKAYLSNNMSSDEMAKSLNELGVTINYLEKKNLDKMVKGTHQGIILDIPDYKYISEENMLSNLSNNPFIVILDHIEDPHNFGAIIRTCEAAGVDFIVIPKNRCGKVNSTVMKTSAGALDNVKIVQVTNLNNTIKKLKQKNLWIVGTAMENSCFYDEIDYRLPIALVIGNEGFGMSELVKKNCDFIVKIPMFGKINSLNASVATGIMIYEVIRQRK